jgi:hypothetical protein
MMRFTVKKGHSNWQTLFIRQVFQRDVDIREFVRV